MYKFDVNKCLINAVKARPIIYQLGEQNYYDKQVRESAWQEVWAFVCSECGNAAFKTSMHTYNKKSIERNNTFSFLIAISS